LGGYYDLAQCNDAPGVSDENAEAGWRLTDGPIRCSACCLRWLVDYSDSESTKGGIALPAPSGSDQLNASDRDGVEYVRYSSTSKSAEEVVASYKSAAKSAGWTISNDSGGGGGWGAYGGSNAELRANKGGEYFAVAAGGERGGETYFEACSGSGSATICDNLSEDAHTGSGGSGYHNNRNKSHSNWS